LELLISFLLVFTTGCVKFFGKWTSSTEPVDFMELKLGMTKDQIPTKFQVSTCKKSESSRFHEALDEEVGIEDLVCEPHDHLNDIHLFFFNQRLFMMTATFVTRWSDDSENVVRSAVMNKFGSHFTEFTKTSYNIDSREDIAATCFSAEACKSWHWIEKGNFEVRYSAESGGRVPYQIALIDLARSAEIQIAKEKAAKKRDAETEMRAKKLGY